MKSQIFFVMCLLICDSSIGLTSVLYDDILNSFDCGCNRTTDFNVSRTKIYLYNFETSFNDSYYINEAAVAILNRGDFNLNQCVQIYVPGFTTDVKTNTADDFRCSVSQTQCNGMKPLALVVDHSPYLNGNFLEKLNLINLYKEDIKYVKPIGAALGNFVVSILDKVKLENIDILGHSLGAHIVGQTAEIVLTKTGIPLKRIYGADPARPCYDNCVSEHFRSGQAELVVAIHTNAGELGTALTIADYDFFAGDGVIQRICGVSIPLLLVTALESSCSHSSSVPIACNADMIQNTWKAVKCSSADKYLAGDCDGNKTAYAGFRVEPEGSKGIYYFTPSEKLLCYE